MNALTVSAPCLRERSLTFLISESGLILYSALRAELKSSDGALNIGSRLKPPVLLVLFLFSCCCDMTCGADVVSSFELARASGRMRRRDASTKLLFPILGANAADILSMLILLALTTTRTLHSALALRASCGMAVLLCKLEW
jgi:hypothetical protein